MATVWMLSEGNSEGEDEEVSGLVSVERTWKPVIVSIDVTTDDVAGCRASDESTDELDGLFGLEVTLSMHSEAKICIGSASRSIASEAVVSEDEITVADVATVGAEGDETLSLNPGDPPSNSKSNSSIPDGGDHEYDFSGVEVAGIVDSTSSVVLDLFSTCSPFGQGANKIGQKSAL